ncbi:Gfo/Idh/MocA family oxidoreductase [Kribbella capetownensis]|uniref:Gfo/Idh/MocA family oxidoreductase n=1 Tax=Kribbella capetownensis TaxID=1572659 RepID=A0A4R0K3L6_9ACTN|nr:Gfo/Idh/MocA family oxidoreductase [Kribbella capetownensis]TCC52348.1 Gfo/Idh/MocA family oxidoreductase [Kribbella capetownensis]
MTVTYQFEYSERLRCAFIGAGGHSYRNVYPTFQYAPVELVAVCDVQLERAQTYARGFGAPSAYDDHHEMLARERPDAVFIVTSYTAEGDVQATALAEDCLRAGAHVWMEKPTAAGIAQLDRLQAVADETGLTVMTGLKKIFTPAMEKVKAILSTPEFGTASSISVRYPQSLPAPDARSDDVAMIGFLDHIFHPGAILTYLMGPVRRIGYEWEPRTGSSVSSLLFESGAVGTLHLAAGSATGAPLERVEVIGSGANVVVDNGVRMTYYRAGAESPYGRSASFITGDDVAPLHWEPEFSLGQLYNKNLFYLGYVPEVVHFCESVLAGKPPEKGTLADVREILKLYELYRRLPAGEPATIEPRS